MMVAAMLMLLKLRDGWVENRVLLRTITTHSTLLVRCSICPLTVPLDMNFRVLVEVKLMKQKKNRILGGLLVPFAKYLLSLH